MDLEIRRARAGVSVIFAVCGATFATWASRVPAAQQALGLSTGQLAVALFMLAAGSIAALSVTGLIIAKTGSKRGSVAGVTVLCAGLFLIVVAPNLAAFSGALFVLGAGNSLLDVSMNAHAARVELAYGRPIFAGFHAFWNIGGLAGSGLSALMAHLRVPIAHHFTAVAIGMFALGLGAIHASFLRTPDVDQQGPALVVPSKALLPLGVIAFCGFLIEGTVNDWSAVYLSTETMSSAGVASLGYFAFSIAMIVVRLIADRFASSFGASRLMRGAAIVVAVGLVVIAAVPIPVVGVLGFSVVGLGVSAMVPLAWSAAAQRSPDAPGQAISAVAACGYLGFLLGPAMLGVIASTVGLRWAMISVLVFVAVVYLLAGSVRTRVKVDD